MTTVEENIRKKLGVPTDATSVFLLGMHAHMDWDWLNTFQSLVCKGNGDNESSVNDIITLAWQLMTDNQQSNDQYMYSVCEMGFLRAVLELHPQLITQFQEYNLSQQLSIEGGGITSPDNLLPHGEAFIRNYLVGWAWQKAVLGLPAICAYMPDDFGHDAQLPVMLEGMGFKGVCFSRIPGSWASSQSTPLDGNQSLYQQLMEQGADLFWDAADGSSVLAHLEQYSYCQGDPLSGYCDDPQSSLNTLSNFLEQNKPSSLSPYIYLSCGCDFKAPVKCLLKIAKAWNTQTPVPSTYVVVGTLEQYIQLVLAWSSENVNKLVTRNMDPTPYWTGYYASRPALKILHHATVRALLGAEVFSTIANSLQLNDGLAWAPVKAALQQALKQGWETLAPSTHHDYISGTAVDSVYSEEQLPLLRAAHTIAAGARKTAIEEIAALIQATPGAGEIPVAVFNQHGFATSGLVEIQAPIGRTPKSVRSASNTLGTVQYTPDGKLLFIASAPSLGYETYYLSDQPCDNPQVWVELSQDGSTITIKNSQMQLILSKEQYWAITSLKPVSRGQLPQELIPADQSANSLIFYKDLGNIYNFGNESDSAGLVIVNGQLEENGMQVIEDGPLRVRIQAQVSFDDGTSKTAYVLEYILVAGEPYVRMAVTGSAPLPNDISQGGTPYSVIVRFPFTRTGKDASPVDSILRGTPYHWHNQLPVAYWNAPTFQATHYFVVPSSSDLSSASSEEVMGALYHADIPAWAIDETGAVIGCILRNTPGVWPWQSSAENRGADGVDFGVHTRKYALRIPQGIQSPPASLMLFQESQSFSTPLQGTYINVPTDGVDQNHPVNVSFPQSFSLASITSGNAMITAAKEGQFNPDALILRIYQPTNGSETVILSLNGNTQTTQKSLSQVALVTALEQPINDAQSVTVKDDQVTFTMNRALATLEVIWKKKA